MTANGDVSSFSKPACASEAAWDATDATMQTQQPTGPKPPSVDQVIAENSVCNLRIESFWILLTVIWSPKSTRWSSAAVVQVMSAVACTFPRVLGLEFNWRILGVPVSSASNAARSAANSHHRSFLSQCARVTLAPPEKQILNEVSVEIWEKYDRFYHPAEDSVALAQYYLLPCLIPLLLLHCRLRRWSMSSTFHYLP